MATIDEVKTTPKKSKVFPGFTEKDIRRIFLSADYQSADVIDLFSHACSFELKDGTTEKIELDASETVDELHALTKAINEGNLLSLKAMKVTQLQILDRIFLDCAQRHKTSQNPVHAKWYLDKALQAQSQCLLVMDSLAAMKPASEISKEQKNG